MFVSEILCSIVFLSNFNLFQLYQGVSSFVSGNVFEYYLSIATMIHNAALSMFIPVTAGVVLPHMYWMVFGMFSMAFVAEAILSLYTVYVKRFEYSLEIFKKIGANPSINSAFATRKLLQTFGGCKVFLSFVIMGRCFIPPKTSPNRLSLLITIFAVITCIQQLLVSVNFNEENRAQRKMAISLSFLRFPLIVVIFLWCTLIPKMEDGVITTYVAAFIFFDIMVISMISDYFLISDTRKFGSGLKKHLSFRTEEINISD